MADNKNIPQPILKPEIENKYHHWSKFGKNNPFWSKNGRFGSEGSSFKVALVQIMVNNDYLLLSLFV